MELEPAQLLLRSVGYRSLPLIGVLPWDHTRGVVSTDESGRVAEQGTGGANGGSGCITYATGWLRRGPSGVISTNKSDAEQVVDAIIAEWATLPPRAASDRRDVLELLDESVVVVNHTAWKRIDAAEVSNARPDAPREKLVATAALLHHAEV